MDTVLYGRVRFLSTVAPLDSGIANWPSMSRSVKGDMFVCMVSGVKLIPVICHLCFASSVCFTSDLAH